MASFSNRRSAKIVFTFQVRNDKEKKKQAPTMLPFTGKLESLEGLIYLEVSVPCAYAGPVYNI